MWANRNRRALLARVPTGTRGPFRKQSGSFLDKETSTDHIVQQFHPWASNPEERKTDVHIKTCTQMFTATWFMTATHW